MELTSIETLYSKLSRDYPLQEELNEEDVVEWVREALKMIDNYAQFERKKLTLTIADYKAILPADFYSVDQKLNVSTSYRLQGKQIYIKNRTGSMILHYLAMPMDEDNRPFIPDTQEYLDALSYYCVSKMCSNGTIINTEFVNQDKMHDKWLQKKLEARADLHLKNIGKHAQSISDDFHSLRYNTNPSWS